MLRWRLAGAAGFIVPALALIWLDDQFNFGYPGAWLIPLGAFLAGGAAGELVWLFRRQWVPDARIPLTVSGAVAAVLVLTLPVWKLTDPLTCPIGNWGWTAMGLATSVAMVFVSEGKAFPGTQWRGGADRGDRVCHRVCGIAVRLLAERAVARSAATGIVGIDLDGVRSQVGGRRRLFYRPLVWAPSFGTDHQSQKDDRRCGGATCVRDGGGVGLPCAATAGVLSGAASGAWNLVLLCRQPRANGTRRRPGRIADQTRSSAERLCLVAAWSGRVSGRDGLDPVGQPRGLLVVGLRGSSRGRVLTRARRVCRGARPHRVSHPEVQGR